MVQVRGQKLTVKSARETGHKVAGSAGGVFWNFIVFWISLIGHFLSNVIESLDWLAGLAYMAIAFVYSLDSYSHLLGKGAFFSKFYFWGIRNIPDVLVASGLTFIICQLQWDGARERMKKEALGDDCSNLKVNNSAIMWGKIAYFIEGVVALISLFFVDNGLNGMHWLLKPVLAWIMVVGIEKGYRIWHKTKNQ